MYFQGIQHEQVLDKPALRLYRRNDCGGFFLSKDHTIYEFDSHGLVQPLADRPEFAASDFREVLRPSDTPHHSSRRLAVSTTGSHLLVVDGKWIAGQLGQQVSNCQDVCLLDLSAVELPLVRRITEASSIIEQDPFFFLDEERIGLPPGEFCIALSARDLTARANFTFITQEFSPPIIMNCLQLHPGGREFSIGMGEPGWGVYRRLAVSESGGSIRVEQVAEVVFKGRADLWAVTPSPSGTYSFVFLLNHETGLRLPGGPAANTTAEIGEIVRVDRGGNVERLTVSGDLSSDFSVVDAQLWTPKRLPPDTYRICPKGPHDEGLQPVLCPVTDEAVLYPTPGGTLLWADFTSRKVEVFASLGFAVQALCLLSQEGPLVVAGSEGQFLMINLIS
jgi:hypothetical protein